MTALRRVLSLALLVIVLVAGVALGLFNADAVTFDYLAGEIQLPLIALLIIAAAVSAAAVGLALLWPLLAQRGKIARLQRENERLRAEERPQLPSA